MSREAWIVLLVIAGIVLLATLVGVVVLAVRVVRTHRLLTSLGASGKLALYGALLYTIFPIDLLPDPIYLDDMGILAGTLFYLSRLVQKHRAAARQLPGQPYAPPGTGHDRRPVP
ncbi:YkvA family protein [Micromonospora avicenniae]|uniref:YkvA family protein n=1 Tax=Micromonospora avicenniae TaxID=1198245 RepID=UPI00331FC466